MKGDRIVAIIDTGGGSREFAVEATKGGRRVEVMHSGKWTHVQEVTRTGVVVRENKYNASRVLALVDERQEEPGYAQVQIWDGEDPLPPA